MKRDRLIVFGDVSGLADEPKKFASFLTVRENIVTTAFIFFIQSMLKKQLGKPFFRKQIFTIFFQLPSHLNSIKKTLEGACIRKTSKYIPQSALWTFYGTCQQKREGLSDRRLFKYK